VPDEFDGKSIFFPVALGKRSEMLEFHRTQNPNCSSIFSPRREFLDRFHKIGPFFEIMETLQMKVTSLDEFLPRNGIEEIDFVELDTQGSELDILQGAQNFLSRSVLGLRVEVEFAEMYHCQPMFSDVDAYLRKFGFLLFDLNRYHLRRKTCPPNFQAGEQIVWGQALYLRDIQSMPSSFGKQKLCKLALVSSFYGFHSYAIEIINYLLEAQTEMLTEKETGELKAARVNYINSITKNSRLVRLMRFLDRSPFRRLFHNLGSLCYEIGKTSQEINTAHRYFWVD